MATPSSIDNDEDAALFIEELSENMSEVATELLEGNKDQVLELMRDIDKGMQVLEEYLGIEEYDHQQNTISTKDEEANSD